LPQHNRWDHGTVEGKLMPTSFDSGDQRCGKQGTLAKFMAKGKCIERAKVVVDHRESQSQLVKELAKAGADLEFKSLKVGDYVVADDVAIERKTFSDFATSIIDRRLFEQTSAMKEAYGRPVLLLEGGGQPVNGISKEALRGALLSVVLDFGVPVLTAEGPEEAAGIVLAIAKREQRDGSRGVSLKDRRRPSTPDGEREYVVASLPAIEATLAKRLLEKFRTVEGVFAASEKDLQDIDKIGPKKARRIRELLSGEYGKEGTVTASSCGPGQADRREP
jgi:ERCC4-type nuclease